jgi:signal transduction histidine kinase
MIYIFIAAAVIISAAFWVLSQYYIVSILLITGYMTAIITLCILYFLYERNKRRRQIKQINEVIDGALSDNFLQEHEWSPLISKIQTAIKSSAAAGEKVNTDRERIARLVSDISHQTKTPLANIIMYSDILLEKERSEFILNIRSQAEKLRFLFDALVKISRCESGLIPDNLHITKSSIKDMLCKAVANVYPAAETKSIEIIVDTAEYTALFDIKWTAEAIFNILDNAVKYSESGSTVKIGVTAYDLFIRIDISDSGIGISEDELQKIWKRFYRGDQVKNENGVGIGLYLTSLILISEHGYVTAKSKIGKGSVFSVFLPKT